MDAEQFDERDLDLNEAQQLALKGLQAFLGAGVSEMMRRDGAFAPATALASHALSAAVQVVQSNLPSCPYAPPGKPITVQFQPPDNAMVLRCSHTPTAHCWDGIGSKPWVC